MSNSEIERILARQREIQDEITRLQQEAEELLIALRVIRRFSPSTEEAETKLGPPRPESTPTLFEMTEAVIAVAGNGLTGREIVEEIGKKYWPGVKGQQILPGIYQFAKRGRLRKTKAGRFFAVKKNETPDGKASGVSGDEGGASSSIERNEVRS